MGKLGATLVIAAMISLTAIAQTTQQPTTTAKSDSNAVGTARFSSTSASLSNDQLVDRSEVVQGDMKTLNDQLGWLKDLQNALPQLTTAIAQRNKQRQEELENRMNELKPFVGIPQDEQDPKVVGRLIEKAITTKQLDLDTKRQELRAIDSEITSRLNSSAEKKAAQDFKTWMSGGFAALIAVVIIGFFLTASRNTQVIEEIFRGRAGLQFITIFSLVIAIILFGITGVLEGKELAALLGGLAGYILGQSGAVAAASDGAAAGQVRQPAPSVLHDAAAREPQSPAVVGAKVA